jgi:hypothetical protein
MALAADSGGSVVVTGAVVGVVVVAVCPVVEA